MWNLPTYELEFDEMKSVESYYNERRYREYENFAGTIIHSSIK